MGKVTLKPGAELDLLTAAELKTTMEQVLSGFARPAITVRDFQNTRLDSNGDSGIEGVAGAGPVPIYTVDAGYTISLHRLAISAEGYDFGTPYTGTGYIEIQRAGRFVDALNLAAGIPAVFTWGSDAPDFNNGESVDIVVVGGPANVVVTFDLQATLESLPGDLVFE